MTQQVYPRPNRYMRFLQEDIGLADREIIEFQREYGAVLTSGMPGIAPDSPGALDEPSQNAWGFFSEVGD